MIKARGLLVFIFGSVFIGFALRGMTDKKCKGLIQRDFSHKTLKFPLRNTHIGIPVAPLSGDALKCTRYYQNLDKELCKKSSEEKENLLNKLFQFAVSRLLQQRQVTDLDECACLIIAGANPDE